MEKRTDYSLLLLISEKDRRAFDLFYKRYIKLIYSFVYHELNDQVMTDDLIQDFWIKVWENPSFLKCNDQGSVQSYMLQHLRFRMLDIYRKTLKNIISIDKLELKEIIASSYNSITSRMEEEELVSIICEALNSQPPLVQKTFWLRINNWSVEEIAKTLTISHKTVYNKYSKSLSIVRSHIKKKYPELVEDFNLTIIGKKFFLLRSLLY
ncbi:MULTISPECIES: RNA polymerase sigma factor [unclassified Proteiniphilum]|uniref:RNA polymerase sigma factor n=1 Tax=unclassified Proteiniphilum TaxID=2622718 RepID=UPI00257B5ACC|nr:MULTISPECIES: sigma-70 family RNA polymerase sigma factor [unclassified Proteiniphilum]